MGFGSRMFVCSLSLNIRNYDRKQWLFLQTKHAKRTTEQIKIILIFALLQMR